ncbi:hypothetical protein QF030_004105 [Streptomyces rishiriensis]|uniref:Basic proline-rich protein-like n=1 Tax=Streptomyces rishiriensis TaxID=68264 RepID=A0ABU0NRZ3_STRRH|nr:hypothetical protein [Streptomyces rishiriensis]
MRVLDRELGVSVGGSCPPARPTRWWECPRHGAPPRTPAGTPPRTPRGLRPLHPFGDRPPGAVGRQLRSRGSAPDPGGDCVPCAPDVPRPPARLGGGSVPVTGLRPGPRRGLHPMHPGCSPPARPGGKAAPVTGLRPGPRRGLRPLHPCGDCVPCTPAGAPSPAPLRGLRPLHPCGGSVPCTPAGAPSPAPLRGLRPLHPCGDCVPCTPAGTASPAPLRGLRPLHPCGDCVPCTPAGTASPALRISPPARPARWWECPRHGAPPSAPRVLARLPGLVGRRLLSRGSAPGPGGDCAPSPGFAPAPLRGLRPCTPTRAVPPRTPDFPAASPRHTWARPPGGGRALCVLAVAPPCSTARGPGGVREGGGGRGGQPKRPEM